MHELFRTRWAAVGAAVAVTLGAGGVSLTQAAISSGEKPVVITVDTTRILDTRTGLGLPGGRFVDSTPQDLQVTGDVPIAPSGTATVVPAGAVGVLVNVTVVAPSSKGFLSLRSGGAAGTPSTSTVNFEAGITTPNAATVDLSADGKVQIWLETDADGGNAHVLLDIVGYTVDHDHDDAYYTKAHVDTAIADRVASDDGKTAYTFVCFPGSIATLDVPYDLTACGYNYNPSGSPVTVTRTSTGFYRIDFPGLSMTDGHVQVTAYGSGNAMCKVFGWGHSNVYVNCYDNAGDPANSMFNVMALD